MSVWVFFPQDYFSMPWNATSVPVSCYFHMKSRVFYSQAYIFNTREFKLRCVFVEAAQCKSFHLRRSNKLEKCSEKEMKGREDATQWELRQEFIPRQEEPLVQIEAGDKPGMKMLWEPWVTSMAWILLWGEPAVCPGNRYWNDPPAFSGLVWWQPEPSGCVFAPKCESGGEELKKQLES